MLMEEAEFPDGREDGGVGGVLESKDNLERGRAQQEASHCGIQQLAATGGTILLYFSTTSSEKCKSSWQPGRTSG